MPAILFSSKNLASRNIANQLIELGYSPKTEGEWEKNYIRLIDTNVDSILDVPTNIDTDYIIVLSTHKSKHEQNAFTAHFPGNWSNADFGGQSRTLNIAHASKLKSVLQNIKKENNRKEWEVTLEVDHHGPTCNLPIIFVEIGSTEKQWQDVEAAKVVASALEKAIRIEDKKFETVFAVGGGHYPKEFSKIELEDRKIAIGHIVPKYHLDSLDEDIFKQAIEKNVEKVKQILVLKESVNTRQKLLLKKLCDSFSVEYTEI